MVYSTTVAYFANRLAGAPTVDHSGAGNIAPLSTQQVMELQRLLIKQGYEGIGEVDGKIGNGTRKATKKAQLKIGLPADAYPTTELIDRLRIGTASDSNRELERKFRRINALQRIDSYKTFIFNHIHTMEPRDS